MKKLYYLAALCTALLTVAACQQELANEEENAGPNGPMTLTALTDIIDTKTTMEYKYDIKWQKGDQITVWDEDYYSGTYDTFTLVGDGGTTSGSFRQDGDENVGGNIIAYYPADIAGQYSNDIWWPEVQHQDQQMLMYAQKYIEGGKDETLQFKSMGAIMQLIVSSKTPGVTLKSIKIQDSEKSLSGRGEFDIDNGEISLGSQSKPVTLDLGNGVALGETAKFFNICIPPGTYNNLTFTFTAVDGAVCTKTRSTPLEVKRNVVGRMTTSCEFAHEAVQLWEDGPFWATTNIGAASPEEYGWYFTYANVEGYSWDGTNWKNALTGATLEGGFTSANYDTTPGKAFGKNPLDQDHDAAHVIMGGEWRIPTIADFEALMENTTIEATSRSYNGTTVTGLLATGKGGGYSDKSIFFPASGSGQSGLQYAKQRGTYGTSAPASIWYYLYGSGECSVYDRYADYGGRPIRAVYSAPIPVEGISISPESLQIREGYDAKVTALLLPENASGNVVWTSTDTDVVTVDQEGNISGISAGHAAVVAACDEKMAFCNVEVIPWVKVTSVSLNQTSVTASLGQELTLTPTILPANASDKTVIWSSDNTSVATVDQNGKVTCRDYGQVRITAASNEYPDITAYCDINVTIVPVSSVSLNKTELTLEVDGSETLIATITPYNADNQSVTWRTSNRSAVIVDDGKVYAVGKGSATITVTTDDGAHTASCTVYSRFTEVGVQLWEGGPFWATHNFGGGKPEDYGKHVCWGDDKGFIYNNSSWWLPGALTNNTYSFTEANYNTNTCTSPVQNFGYIKNISRDLSGADGTDIVAYEWTQKIDSTIPWHIPSVQDFENLLANTRYEWFSDYEGTGVAGCLFTGTGYYSDKSIFIPAAGLAVGSYWENYEFDAYHSTCIGYYMTRDYQTDFPDQVKFFMLDERAIFSQYNTSTAFGLNPRYEGFSIRPVHYPGE